MVRANPFHFINRGLDNRVKESPGQMETSEDCMNLVCSCYFFAYSTVLIIPAWAQPLITTSPLPFSFITSPWSSRNGSVIQFPLILASAQGNPFSNGILRSISPVVWIRLSAIGKAFFGFYNISSRSFRTSSSSAGIMQGARLQEY